MDANINEEEFCPQITPIAQILREDYIWPWMREKSFVTPRRRPAGILPDAEKKISLLPRTQEKSTNNERAGYFNTNKNTEGHEGRGETDDSCRRIYRRDNNGDTITNGPDRFNFFRAGRISREAEARSRRFRESRAKG